MRLSKTGGKIYKVFELTSKDILDWDTVSVKFINPLQSKGGAHTHVFGQGGVGLTPIGIHA